MRSLSSKNLNLSGGQEYKLKNDTTVAVVSAKKENHMVQENL